MKPTTAATGKADAAEPPPGPSSPQQTADSDSALAGSNISPVSTPTVDSVFINPALLTIRPQHHEVDFWQSRRITQQLMTVDKTAFVMSTLNIYSGMAS